MTTKLRWRKQTRFRDRFCVICGALVPAGENTLERDYRARVITLCDQCANCLKERVEVTEFGY